MIQKWGKRYRVKQWLAGALLVLFSSSIARPAIAQSQPQDVEAIVRTRNLAVEAINTRDFTKIEPYLHPAFTITTVDNRIFHKVTEFEQYWNQQFSSSIRDIKMEVKVDTPRVFLSPETAVSYGDAIATFYFTDGKDATMAMRWTAVLQKFQNKWTIQSLHFSSNLLDNPVLNRTQQLIPTVGIAAGIGGLLLGAIATLLWRRLAQQRR